MCCNIYTSISFRIGQRLLGPKTGAPATIEELKAQTGGTRVKIES